MGGLIHNQIVTIDLGQTMAGKYWLTSRHGSTDCYKRGFFPRVPEGLAV